MITPTSILPAAVSSTPTTPTTTSSGLPTSQGLDTMFLQLLVAQLQNQDPTSPLDPSQFVGQLAQFSELSEVTQIDQILQQYAGAGSGTSGSGTTGSGTTGGSSPTPGSAPIPANPLTAATPSPILSSAVSAARAALSNFSSPSASVLSQIQGVF
jgi:flagellar basal-body rod modification protein FlgD